MKSSLVIIEQMRDALETRNYTNFVNCFDKEAIYELPFAPKGKPSRYEGIEKIRELFSNNMTERNELFELHKVDVKTYPGERNNIVCAEYSLHGKIYSTGEFFKISSSVAIISFRNEKVINYRDYPNSIGFAQSLNTVPQFLESLGK